MNPLVVGGLAIGALLIIVGSKKESNKPPVLKKSGETWHLILAIHPAINSSDEFKQFETALRYIVTQSGQGELVEVEYPAPNTVDITIKYIKGAQPMPVNEQVQVGQYTLQVTLSERVG